MCVFKHRLGILSIFVWYHFRGLDCWCVYIICMDVCKKTKKSSSIEKPNDEMMIYLVVEVPIHDVIKCHLICRNLFTVNHSEVLQVSNSLSFEEIGYLIIRILFEYTNLCLV